MNKFSRGLIGLGMASVLVVGGALPAEAESLSRGLDRLDQATATLDGKFVVDGSGLGVTAYVLDTGVNVSDPGFGGRASGDQDCNGHGTHVAGTLGSAQFGVAKLVKIVSIKVSIACTGGVNPSDLVKGIEKVLKMHPAGQPGVVNISITLGKSAAIDAAIDKLSAAGLTAVVAASNTYTDACKFSPSGTTRAFTVGSVNINDYRTNTSAYGNCVDIFAPGTFIDSEDYKDPAATKQMSGTSMASPHVAGVAALYLEKNPAARPAEVMFALQSGALKGAVVNALSQNGNYLLNTAFLAATQVVVPTPVASPVVSAPQQPTPSATSVAAVSPSPTLTVATELPKPASGLYGRPASGGLQMIWNAPLNAAKTGALTYKLDASNDKRTWVQVGQLTTETSAAAPIYKYYRVTAIGAHGSAAPSLVVMVGNLR